MGPDIKRFEGYVPYTWMADTIIRPDGYYKLSAVRLFGYPNWICARESGVSEVMWSYFLNGKNSFSELVMSHVCDRFAIPASLVKDVHRYQQIEWMRRNGQSDEPCNIPSHYAHYFEEVNLERLKRFRDKSHPRMQALYDERRKRGGRFSENVAIKAGRVAEMQKYIEERDAERKRLEAEAVASLEADDPGWERPSEVLPSPSKSKSATKLVRR